MRDIRLSAVRDCAETPRKPVRCGCAQSRPKSRHIKRLVRETGRSMRCVHLDAIGEPSRDAQTFPQAALTAAQE
jgi:hypothetical protein